MFLRENKMVIYQNQYQTVRIIKRFDDRLGVYCYYLEKWLSPIKFCGWTIFKGKWSDGSTSRVLPPVYTYEKVVLDAWIKEYNCEEII
jgi:hypothetical protein